MKKIKKPKFYALTNVLNNEFYSLMFFDKKIIKLNTMKRKNYALFYTLDEAKFFKKYLLEKYEIFSIITAAKNERK